MRGVLFLQLSCTERVLLLLLFNIWSHVNFFILLRLQLCLAVFVLTDTAPMPNLHKLKEEYLEGLHSVACCLCAPLESKAVSKQGSEEELVSKEKAVLELIVGLAAGP